ncbi:MAG: hypothetical protein H5T50_04170 [Nitrososphaeria archaeon]|nr:hypothetical protein [Nitrososphaeria archaeon]
MPKELESERGELERKLRELVEFEVKRNKIIKFFEGLMEGTRQLSEKEVVEFSRKFKEAGVNELRDEGLLLQP